MSNAVNIDALHGWMTGHVAGYAGPLAVEKFAGGQSNPTYRLTTPARAYVLRRKPVGPILPSAHAVDREYRVIAALGAQGFPVPQVHALCEDAAVLGSAFYVMDMVEGEIYWDGALPGLAPTDRRKVYEDMISTLAALHAIDPVAAGLSDFGRPGNYLERQVARWTKQYRASQTDDIDEVERLIEWLPNRVPAQSRVAIIHGDYRIDNLIFSAEKKRVSAVLDWELATLGDPLADFAYLAMNWIMPVDGRSGLAGLDCEAAGIPTLEQATEIYTRKAGWPMPERLSWYFAFNLFRLTGIAQGVKKRWLDGSASSSEAAGFADKIVPLAQAAWAQARRAGAK